MVRLLFGFSDLCLKVLVLVSLGKLKWLKIRYEMVTLKAWVTSLVKWGYEGVLGLFPRIRANDI